MKVLVIQSIETGDFMNLRPMKALTGINKLDKTPLHSETVAE